MTEHLRLVVCSTLEEEVRTVLSTLESPKFLVSPVQCLCHIPLAASRKLFADAVAGASDQGRHQILVLGRLGCMVAELPGNLAQDVRSFADRQCFELIAPPKLIEHLQGSGAFLTSPGWIRKWKHVMREWGADRDAARLMFQEMARKIVLLDTFCSEEYLEQLYDFADYVGLPVEIMPIGLEYLQSRLGNEISHWRASQSARELDHANRNASDNMMVMDLLKDVVHTLDEEGILEKIRTLLEMLLAPKSVRFCPPDNCSATTRGESLTLQEKSKVPALWDVTISGFRIPLVRDRLILCWIECEGIMFPEYRDHYSQLISMLSDVFALSINNARIHDTLKCHALELDILRVKADAANKSKSAFLASMSHEIRTPMNGIFGLLQLLQTTALDDEQGEYVEMTMNAAKNLLNLLNDILDLSKVEAGKIDIHNSEFNLSDLCRSMPSIFIEQIHKKNIALAINIAPDVPSPIISDEVRLRQVLFNLVGNAMKFTESGSVNVQIGVGSNVGHKRTLHFSVTDTGIGIPEDQIRKLFKPFTQVDDSLSRKHQGAGLGLSIVKHLVELMGGSIGLESILGQGTTVRFDILVGILEQKSPEIYQEPSRPDSVKEKIPQQALNLKILLVEDDEISQIFVKRLLGKYGAEIVCAQNGEDALKILSNGTFDIVLMDIRMPVMDGIAAAKHIRKMDCEACRNIPIIAMTANAMSGDREKVLAAGMNDYIAKPFEVDALRAIIDRIIGEKKESVCLIKSAFSRPGVLAQSDARPGRPGHRTQAGGQRTTDLGRAAAAVPKRGRADEV